MSDSLQAPFQILSEKKSVIEKWIEKRIITDFGQKTILRDACEYALLNGGKRFRPTLVLLIAEEINKNRDVSYAALAVEYFHTASLVADDLPCMDDDDERRNRPSLHKAFGESIALLASYSLISAGYESIANNAQQIENGEKICLVALQNTGQLTGILGTTGGQLMDLYLENFSLEHYFEVIDKKTGTLFELSFLYGWLFGGGSFEHLDIIRAAAIHFGRAFQIADDIEDKEMDATGGQLANLVNYLGESSTIEILNKEIELFLKCLSKLPYAFNTLKELVNSLKIDNQPLK